MHSSSEQKKLVVLTTVIRWFYGILFITLSLMSLSHVHMIATHAAGPIETYEMICCNPFWVVFLSVGQLIIGLLLLVPQTALWGVWAGIGLFAYVLVRLWMQGVSGAFGVNLLLALGLIVLSQLLYLNRANLFKSQAT